MFFIGHKKNWNILIQEIKKNRLPPAYLFYGAPGIGKKLVAQTYTQFLFCRTVELSSCRAVEPLDRQYDSTTARQNESQPCGQCSSCQRVLANTHPDHYLIEAEEKTIKIDELRQLQKSLMKAPLEAPLKVVIIDNAQEMTLQAANSLLKILEEPPKNTLFILIAPHLFRLLPTIRSRCRSIFFSAPSIDESISFLKTKDELSGSIDRNLLGVTEGSIGLATKLAEEDFNEVAKRQDQLLKTRNISFSSISSMVQDWMERDSDIFLLLEILKKKYFQQMKTLSSWDDVDKIDQISRAQKDIEQNVNKALVMENLFMNLLN